MSMFTIRIEENEGLRDDEKLPPEAKAPIELDGFMLLGVRDDKPFITMIHHITTQQIADVITDSRDKAKGVIFSAYALAEGAEKAEEIKRKDAGPAAFADLFEDVMKKHIKRQAETVSAATE